MTSGEFQERLALRAHAAGAALTEPLGERLEVYFRLLESWNEKINLTALPLADPTAETLDRLLIEPLVAAHHVSSSARSLVDIGSGGGSPALPLVLAAPQLRLLMVESRTRKSVFLREAVRVLELDGAEVATARFEQLLTDPANQETYDLLSIRAVRVEADVLSRLQEFVRPGGQLFLFRGDALDAQIAVQSPLVRRAMHQLTATSASHLVILSK